MPTVRTSDAALATALMGAGARLVRHAHEMQLDLSPDMAPPVATEPALPGPLRLTPVDRPAAALGEASLASYPGDHPDGLPTRPESLPQAAAHYDRLLGGGIAGPLLPAASGLLLEARDGAVAAAVIVTLLAAGPSWPGGPWVADLFVVPAHRGSGLGRRLLERAVAACAAGGHARLGFRRFRTVFVLRTS
jgi:GNAT superfamily N-acetyltransferase